MTAESEARREWAKQQIDLLKKQRDGIDRRIRDFEGFLMLLDQSEVAVQAAVANPAEPVLFDVDHPSPESEQMESRNGDASAHGGRLMSEYIEEALLRAGNRGMKQPDVAHTIVNLGYDYGEGKKSTLVVAVRAELYRLARRHRRGIRQIGAGRFAIRQ